MCNADAGDLREVMPVTNSDKYLLDGEGNIIHYANGQPVRLDDFDQAPSEKAYAEVNKMPYKELIQLALDSGVYVTDEMLRKAGFSVE